MKSIITSLFIIIAACGTSLGQTPTYSAVVSLWPNSGGSFGNTIPDTERSDRLQVIYHTNDFNSTRSGNINNVYFRMDSSPVRPAGETVYYKMKISMGYSPKPVFKHLPNYDSFITELQVVYYKDSINLGNLTDPKYFLTWLKFPLNKGNFFLDTSRNFVLEVTTGPPSAKCGLLICGSTLTECRSLYGSAFLPTANTGDNTLYDFGFDIDVTGVEGIKNIQSFGLFPNPSSGSFQMSFDAAKPVQEAKILVTNSNGQVVYMKNMQQLGTHFFRAIDLSSLPKGTYYLELRADADILHQKLILK